MTQNTNPPVEPAELEKGDMISLSTRDTPMEVQSIKRREITGSTVTAANHYGEYTLRYHPDETWTVRISGDQIGDGLEVKRIDG